jgi:sugar lactone lactonase YvrE
MQVERLVEAAAELGEGPVWRSETEEILWVDILRGEVHASTIDGHDQRLASFADPVSAVALTRGGDPVVATPDGLVRMDGRVVAGLERSAPDIRMNDGKPDPGGRFVGGTMSMGEPRPRAGSLWSFGPGAPRELIANATIANGIAWAIDGRTMFWIDTPTGRVDAFDYDPSTGAIFDRRPWITVPAEAGSPDGMCIDSEGGLWVALWGGSAVRRYVDQKLEEVVTLPTPLVTCPTFGGPDLTQLIVTTASVGLDSGSSGAGDLYVVDAEVCGVAPNRLGSWAD